MRIALLADVHANLPALQAVISDSLSRSVDEYWNLGDMVGYAPFPNEVVSLLHRQCVRHVLGNHDLKCADAAHAGRMRAAGKDPDKIFSFEWTHRVLTPESRALIARTPRVEQVPVDAVGVLMTHGSPRGMNDCLTPRTPWEKLKLISSEVGGCGVQVVLCGHTHEFFEREAQGVRFINPGGVGRSFDGDTRASYCILDIRRAGRGAGPGRVRVEPVRVPYPVEALAGEMRSRAFSPRLVRSIEEARSLEDLDGLKAAEAGRCLEAAVDLSKKFPHQAHARQVARLAEMVFEELKPLHGLGRREGVYLRAAAFLHDIGWIYGNERHHKTSRDLIEKDRSLPLDRRERAFVALIARYHRGSLPEMSHKVFKDLTSYEQETVSVLAACLRIADGLDRTHGALVERLEGTVGPGKITLSAYPALEGTDLTAELAAARTKADLLERIFGRAVVVRAG